MTTQQTLFSPNNNLILPKGIFNLERDHTDRRILLGDKPSLVDSVNMTYPELFAHYKNQRSLDWDEQEFRYETTLREFARGDSDSEIMTDTIAWQWEADSIVANAVPQVVHSTITNSEALLGYAKIVEIEMLHSLTYSEITRMAFKDPNTIINRVIGNESLHERLSDITIIFEEARVAAAKYSLGLISRAEAIPPLLLFYCALPTLERCQFMPSFAITFGYGEMGRFMAVVNAVQKICQDELEVHIPFNLAIVRTIFTDPEMLGYYDQIHPRLVRLIRDIHGTERAWIIRTLEGRDTPETFNEESLHAFNDYSCTYMARFFEFSDRMDFNLVDRNPINYMDQWVNLSLVQTSPQEQDNNQYKVDILRRNDDGMALAVNF